MSKILNTAYALLAATLVMVLLGYNQHLKSDMHTMERDVRSALLDKLTNQFLREEYNKLQDDLWHLMIKHGDFEHMQTNHVSEKEQQEKTKERK